MTPDHPLEPPQTKPVWKYLLAYGLFAIFILVAVIILFRMRMNIIQIGFLMGYNQVQVKGIANLGVLFTGLLVLVGVVFSEDYLRNGVEKGLLFKRARLIFLVEGAIIAAQLGLYYLIMLLTLK